jgi:hypothetical protein
MSSFRDISITHMLLLLLLPPTIARGVEELHNNN